MGKYYVKVIYPDFGIIGCPMTQAVFMIIDKTSEKAAERGKHWGMAILADIMKHNKINPYEIELAAPELVRVVAVKEWEEGRMY